MSLSLHHKDIKITTERQGQSKKCSYEPPPPKKKKKTKNKQQTYRAKRQRIEQ